MIGSGPFDDDRVKVRVRMVWFHEAKRRRDAMRLLGLPLPGMGQIMRDMTIEDMAPAVEWRREGQTDER